MKVKPFKTVPALIVAGVILLVCLARILDLDFFQRLEHLTYDMRVRCALRFPSPVATNLGFVFINEESIRAVADGRLGYRFGLYWPRQVYGRLVHELAAQGAKALAFDVIFGELRPDHAPVQLRENATMESDEFFAQQMLLAGNVILAVTREVIPPPLFLTNAIARGDISTDKDPDGILRRARAFRTYRSWHPLFRQVEADPEYGVDLRRARVEPRRIVLPRTQGDDIVIPLDEEGNFELADFVGDTLPPGLPAKAKPFTEERIWHMGVVLAARELGLDLDRAELDFAHGRITLPGAGDAKRIIPVDAEGCFYIDWCLPPNDPRLTQEAIHDLLRQNRQRLEGQTNLPARWQGKLAVLGSSAMGNDLTDRGATPLAPDMLLVSKHWNVANSILTGRFVRRASLPLELGLIVLLGLLAAFLTWRAHALLGATLILLAALGYAVLAVILYVQSRYWLPVALPLLGALLMTHVCLVTWRVVFEQAEKRRVKSIFSTIVSPKIVQELLQAKSLALGGARREITVLFADVRGFTALTDASQEHAAQQVRERQLTGAAAEAVFDEQARDTLQTVNLYLGLVADTIINQDGTLDKFIGDCVMAFWGAPVANPRHALQCVRAAIDAQRAVHALNLQRARENQERRRQNQSRAAAGQPPLPLLPLLCLGTGINTGLATVGLMGAESKAVVRQGNYTVFGREVNLAQRLETLSGRARIFISQTTLDHLQRDDPALAASCLALPPVTVKGIRTPVQVYEVPWLPPGAPPIPDEADEPADAPASPPA